MKNKNTKNFLKILGLVGIGTVSGLINGFFGAGGGLLIVPMLGMFTDSDSKTVHATTLACVLFMCLASSVIYFIKGEFDFKFIVVCSIGSVAGSLIGTKLLKKLKNDFINLIFSLILILAGIFMIVF